jgi:MbtH protein
VRSTDCPKFYRVIVNGDRCYGIWPTDVAVPPGWTPTGFTGTGEAALSQVAELWRMAHTEQDRNRSDRENHTTDE